MDILERKAAAILIPAQIWEDLCRETNKAELDIETYHQMLNEFAFEEGKDYTGFRTFLFKRSSLFGERYTSLTKLTNMEIDYILKRVVEEKFWVAFGEDA